MRLRRVKRTMLSMAYGRVCQLVWQGTVKNVLTINSGSICQQSLRSAVWRSPMCVVCLHKKLIASIVECVLTWIREQYLVVCNIAKWTILCIVVHFQPVGLIKVPVLQKGVRVHRRRVILMPKMQFFFWGGSTAPSPVRRATSPPHAQPPRS